MTLTVKILSILTTMALFLPVFSGYVLAFAMLICQLLPAWRQNKSDFDSAATDLWTKPILMLLLFLTIRSWWSIAVEPASSFDEGLKFWGNNLVKYGLLWFFMRGFIARAVSRYQFADYLARAIGPIACIHFLYCMLQRYTGVDWADGLDAVLPPNRFAYGVYRVSGFSSHPLTIGYQLCFVTVLGAGLGSLMPPESRRRLSAFAGSLFAGLAILISGSRGPQVVLVAVGCLLALYRLPKGSWKALVPAGVLALAGAWQLGMLNRFTEVGLSGSGDSRAMDWKAYSQAFLDHPIWGMGPAGFKLAIADYYAQFNAAIGHGLAHNFFLQVAAETGVVGLAVFFYWMYTWLNFSRKFPSPKDRSIFYALIAVMVLSALTQNSLRDSGVVFDLTFVTMVLANLLQKSSVNAPHIGIQLPGSGSRHLNKLAPIGPPNIA